MPPSSMRYVGTASVRQHDISTAPYIVIHRPQILGAMSTYLLVLLQLQQQEAVLSRNDDVHQDDRTQMLLGSDQP